MHHLDEEPIRGKHAGTCFALFCTAPLSSLGGFYVESSTERLHTHTRYTFNHPSYSKRRRARTRRIVGINWFFTTQHKKVSMLLLWVLTSGFSREYHCIAKLDYFFLFTYSSCHIFLSILCDNTSPLCLIPFRSSGRFHVGSEAKLMEQYRDLCGSNRVRLNKVSGDPEIAKSVCRVA